MKKKGFTLIELLAVIVILAIILLIAVPVVFKTIDKAERSSFESSTRKMSSTAEQRCLEERLEKKAGSFETNFTESGFTGYDIDMKGDNPDGGTVRVNDQCQVEIAVHDSKTCVKKSAASNEFVVIDYEEGNCELVASTGPLGCSFIDDDVPTPRKELVNDILLVAEARKDLGFSTLFSIDDFNIGDLTASDWEVIAKYPATPSDGESILFEHDLHPEFRSNFVEFTTDLSDTRVPYNPTIDFDQHLGKEAILIRFSSSAHYIVIDNGDGTYTCSANDQELPS